MLKKSFKELLNIKDDDLSYLTTQITPHSNDSVYYEKVREDYENNRVLGISVTEYKNFILLDYFVKQILSSHIEKWINYESVKEEAIKAYKMTWNIADKTVSKLNKKEESKLVKVK